MTDRELKTLWLEQEWAPPTAHSDSELIGRMNSKMRQFHRDIFWRDILELAACVFVVCGFTPDLFRSESTLSRAGAAVIVASMILITAMLVIARRRQKHPNASASICECITLERNAIERQCSLLRSVLWWYILPAYVGITLFTFGSPAGMAFKITFTVSFSALCALIYFLNKLAVRKRLLPLRNELDQLLQTLTGSADIPNPTEEN